ncbi:MAG: branched-chain amino acid ABC transporter permease, partial [Synergistes sp.]|nr:branched-chain amino acid ABC transporter permease [Synergistes sp.]
KTNTKKFLSGHRLANLILLAVAALAPLVINATDISSYLMMVGCFILTYIIAVSGLDVIFGYCGQINLGMAGFFAIGAYGSAILNKDLGIPPMVSLLIAAIFAAMVGAIVAFPAANLRFHFLSIATQAFGWIVYYFVVASPGEITGNYIGYFPNAFSIFGIDLSDYTAFFYFALIMCVLFLFIKSMLVNSKTGRAIISIRENVTAAAGMGVNVRKYKIIAFTTAAFFVSVAGSMYGHLSGYIAPASFTVAQSNIFFVMLLFGGSGTFYGPIIGAVFVQILNEIIRSANQYSQLIYGVIMLLIVMFMPNGVQAVNFKAIGKLFKKKDKASEVKKDAEG